VEKSGVVKESSADRARSGNSIRRGRRPRKLLFGALQTNEEREGARVLRTSRMMAVASAAVVGSSCFRRFCGLPSDVL
jgi:hypothetical protein